jgi:hypothetical protein
MVDSFDVVGGVACATALRLSTGGGDIYGYHTHLRVPL